MTKGRALVIGSEGNIGTPLCKRLRAEGWDVLSCDIRPGFRPDFLQIDINQPADLMTAVRWKPDVVFALASVVSRVTCEQASSLSVATNLGGLNNMLLAAREAGAKFVYFSTSEVYGPDDEYMDEVTTKPNPNNRYGLTKLLGESLVEYEVKYSGLKAVTLRPFMMYDEDEDFGDHRSAMIRFAWRLARGEPIEVHADSARGWIHSSDAVKAIELSAGLDDYAIINIGHPDIRPMAEIAEGIRSRLNADPALVTVRPLPPQMTGVKRPALDRMHNLLNFKPSIDIEEGLDRVCNEVKRRLAL